MFKWLAQLTVGMIGLFGALLLVTGLVEPHLLSVVAGGAMVGFALSVFRRFWEHEYE